MAKYTMEIRELTSTFGEDEVKSWFMNYELSDYLTDEEIAVVISRGTWSKEKLAQRIIEHYYTREIGTDAIGQFILFAKDRMHEIMETYAPLIYSVSIKYNPLENVNYTESYAGTSDATSSTTSKASGDSLNVQSDTPQGQISKSAILNGEYATNTSANENSTSATDDSSSMGNQSYDKTIKGNNGKTAQELIEKYRKNIRAIDTEIVYALENLFMGLY